jgi:hypothetical protein
MALQVGDVLDLSQAVSRQLAAGSGSVVIR